MESRFHRPIFIAASGMMALLFMCAETNAFGEAADMEYGLGAVAPDDFGASTPLRLMPEALPFASAASQDQDLIAPGPLAPSVWALAEGHLNGHMIHALAAAGPHPIAGILLQRKVPVLPWPWVQAARRAVPARAPHVLPIARVQLRGYADPEAPADAMDGGNDIRQMGAYAALAGKTVVHVGFGYPRHLAFFDDLGKVGAHLVLLLPHVSKGGDNVFEQYRDGIQSRVSRIVEVPALSRDSAEGYNHWLARFAEANVRALAQALPGRDISAAFSMMEGSLALTARVSRLLGLSYPAVGAVDRMRDKAAMAQVETEAGLPGSDRWQVARIGLYGSFEHDLGRVMDTMAGRFPLIIQPATGGGSTGVSRADDSKTTSAIIHELRQTMLRETQPGADGLVASPILNPDYGIAVRRMLVGPQYSVDFALYKGRLIYGRVVDNVENPLIPGSFALGAFNMPSALPYERQRELIDHEVQVTLHAGMTTGIFHNEVRVEDGGFIHGFDRNALRPAGQVFPYQHDEIHGVHMPALQAMLAAGLEPRLAASPYPGSPDVPRMHVFEMAVFADRPGTFRGVENLWRARQDPRLWRRGTYLEVPSGTTIRDEQVRDKRLAFIGAQGPSHEKAVENYARLLMEWGLGAIMGP